MARKGSTLSAGTSHAAAPAKAKAARQPAQRRPDAQDAAEVSEASIRKEIAKAAYRLAEQRGFAPGNEEADWLAAEAQVKSALGLSGKPN